MNASSTRSKKNLKDVVAESVNNTSIENFYKGDFFWIKYVDRCNCGMFSSANVVNHKKFLPHLETDIILGSKETFVVFISLVCGS